MDNTKAIEVLTQEYHIPVNPEQAYLEVQSLARKKNKGSLDDWCEFMVARLETAYGLDIRDLAQTAVLTWPSSTN